ncbi:MAG: HEPN domain-containing protein [Bacteroidales bacterium]|nr:HEPN domain-containing protein [Bacteroidales bacterium]
MEDEKIDIEKVAAHWISRSDSDFDTLNNLIKTKDFNWALFLGHLVIERLLKSIVVKRTGAHAPLTHDLRRLAKLSELNLTEEYKNWLDTISTFNINARYDDYKQDFYKKCTPDYAITWLTNIKTIREWIKTKL